MSVINELYIQTVLSARELLEKLVEMLPQEARSLGYFKDDNGLSYQSTMFNLWAEDAYTLRDDLLSQDAERFGFLPMVVIISQGRPPLDLEAFQVYAAFITDIVKSLGYYLAFVAQDEPILIHNANGILLGASSDLLFFNFLVENFEARGIDFSVKKDV